MQHHIGLVSWNRVHVRNESPICWVSRSPKGNSGSNPHTGIPTFVLIPAPVTTTTFLDFARMSAISCNSAAEVGKTLIVGIVAAR